METTNPAKAIDPQSSSYYNGGSYQAGSVQAPTASPVALTPLQILDSKKPVSSTVVSNANFIENTKPNIDSRLAVLTQRGQTVGSDGYVRNSDGSLASAPIGSQAGDNGGYLDSSSGLQYGKEANQYSDDPAQDALYQRQFSDLDANTKELVDSYHAQYEGYRAKQNQINAAQEAGREQSLLMGGGSRYAQTSSGDLTALQRTNSLDNIIALDNQEKSLVAQAKAAQASKKYDLLNDLIAKAENVRKEKQDAAVKANDAIAADLKAQKAAQVQATKDASISSIVQKGITDPAQILASLRAAGDKTTTLKDITDSIGNLNPDQKNIYDIMKSAAANGAPKAVIDAIGNAKDVQSAFNAAGDYTQSATGIIGEYNFYKRQAIAAGQTPVDFNTYQNMDANRKAKVAAAGIGGGSDLSSKEATIYNQIVNKFNASPLSAAKDRTVVLQGTIDNVLKNPSDAAQQLALAYGYVQALDTYQSSVREGELNNVNTIDSKAGQLKNYADQMTNGQIMRPEVAKQVAAAAQTLINTITDGANRTQKKYQAQAEGNGSNVGSAFKQFLSVVNDTPGTSDTLHKSGAEAKTAIDSYTQSNPDKAEAIAAMYQVPGANDASIYEELQKRGLIQ